MKTRMLFTVCFALGLTGCYTHIDAGHVGVQINSCSGGGVSDTPLSVGYHRTGPCTTIVEFPTFMQTMVLTKSATEGTLHDDSITANDSDGLPITVDCSISFNVNDAKAPSIYKKYRNDLEHIQQTYMRQSIREAIQEIFGKNKAEQLYGPSKEAARVEIQAALVKKLGDDGFDIRQFTINEWRFPDAVRDAINAKVAMIQKAQMAEQEVKKIQAEGRQRVAAATAAAESARLKADAEAYSNEKLAKSLSPVLVNYLMIQKWDGKLPTVSGGSGGSSFITLPTNPASK